MEQVKPECVQTMALEERSHKFYHLIIKIESKILTLR